MPRSLKRSGIKASNSIKYGNALSGNTGATVPAAPILGTVTKVSATSVSIPFVTSSPSVVPVTSLTVESSPSIPLTYSGTTSPITVNGTFALGVSYSFTVTANNSIGAGPQSAQSNSLVPNVPIVTGGALYSDATYYYRVFTGNGTLDVSGGSVNMDVMLIAGGGGGARGGGGAGGVINTTASISGSKTIVIGAGATNRAANDPTAGYSGGNSSFTGLTTAVGGGGGGSYGDASRNGTAGGSGGGAGVWGSNALGTGGAGTSGQGNAGGNRVGSATYTHGAGGGGAGGAGGSGSTSDGYTGGPGGVGITSNSTWATATGTGVNGGYAGGGGGSAFFGGAGTQSLAYHGGARGYCVETAGDQNTRNGIANTGGGGGGAQTGSSAAETPGRGGSGICIVRYTRASVGG